MKIWTTKPLADTFFPGGKFDLEVCPPVNIQEEFLQKAVPGDMAVMGLPEDYIEFLATAKSKGVLGPFVLISPEPTIIDDQLKRYNALILNIKKTEVSEIREVINFIAKNALECHSRPAPAMTDSQASGVKIEAVRNEAPITDPVRIKQVIEYIFRAGVPMIVSMQILEHGEPVTARGLCYIEAFNDGGMILHRFSSPVFPGILKKDARINIGLTHRSDNFNIVSTVLKAGLADKLLVALPGALIVETRKNVRVEPNIMKPAMVYTLRKDEPTTVCRIVDISLGGMCFETPLEFSVDDVRLFTIVLPEKMGTVLSYGKIMHQRAVASTYRYNVQLGAHPKDIDRIATYIMSREKEIAALLSQYGARKAGI